MTKKVFIVPDPPHSTGKPVVKHFIKEQGGKVLAETKTQEEAIKLANKKGYVPHVARERETKPDPNNPAHWRAV